MSRNIEFASIPVDLQRAPLREIVDGVCKRFWGEKDVTGVRVAVLSVGPSETAVLAVWPMSRGLKPFIVRCGPAAPMCEELWRYLTYVDPLVTIQVGTPSDRDGLVPMAHPDPKHLPRTGADKRLELLGEMVVVSGPDQRSQESFAATGYPHFLRAETRVQALDALIGDCLKNGEVNTAVSALSDLLAVLDRSLYARHLYDSPAVNPALEAERRIGDLPAIQWDRFLPVALSLGDMLPGWAEFVRGLPQRWSAGPAGHGWATVRYHQRVVHGDLRCANILVAEARGGRSIHLVDHSHTTMTTPLVDLGHLEADLLFRFAASSPSGEGLLRTVLDAHDGHEIAPAEWKDNEKEPLLRLLYVIRSAIPRYFGSDTGEPARRVAELWHAILAGAATRIIWTDYPDLRDAAGRPLFLWFALRLFQGCLAPFAPHLPEPMARGALADMVASGVRDYFWGETGMERRNSEKRRTLRSRGLVRLLAHTGESYLDPSTNRFFAEMSWRREEKLPTQVVVLNPYSQEGAKLCLAEARGDLRGPETTIEYYEARTTLFKRFQKTLEAYRNLGGADSGFELRITDYAVTATLLITDEEVYFEPYMVGKVVQRYRDGSRMTAPELLIAAPRHDSQRGSGATGGRASRQLEPEASIWEVLDTEFRYFWARSISVEQYYRDHEDYRAKFKEMLQLRSSLTTLHESWFAVDPISGCRHRCAYCFLRPYQLNERQSPFMVATAKHAYDELKTNDLYVSQGLLLGQTSIDATAGGPTSRRLPVPVACGNNTEMFDETIYDLELESTPQRTSNLQEIPRLIEQHAKLVLDAPGGRRTPILCLMTRAGIREDMVAPIEQALRRHSHVRLAVFVSISFLPSKWEPGFPEGQEKTLLETFGVLSRLNERLLDHGDRAYRRVAGIHWWRPLIPQHHTREKMLGQIVSVKDAGALSSVAVGLKISPKMFEEGRQRTGHHEETYVLGIGEPATRSKDDGLLTVPDGAAIRGKEYASETLQDQAIDVGRQVNHSVYLNSSCAISAAFRQPDYNATWHSPALSSEDDLARTLEQLRLGDRRNQFVVEAAERDGTRVERVVYKGTDPLGQQQIIFLRQMLGVPVVAAAAQELEWQGYASGQEEERCIRSNCDPEQRRVCAAYYDQRRERRLRSGDR